LVELPVTYLTFFVPPQYIQQKLIAVEARSKAWVCGRSLAGIVGSNLAEGMDVYRPDESYRL
jgi:hypothetical protein